MILVTGATGNVGGHVASELQRIGADVRALVRDPDSAALPDGAQVVRGDLSIPETVAAALEGVESVFLVWPFFTAEEAPALLKTFSDHARRIVYLSSMGVRDDLEAQLDPINQFHADMEGLIERSPLEWTVLRASGFAASTLRWAPELRADGVVRGPHGAAGRSLIHEQDLGAVAARALTAGGHAGTRHVLTGPETLTQFEQASTIGAAAGCSFRYEEIAPDVARQELLSHMPPAVVDGILDAHAAFVTEPEAVTRDVEAITGSPARSFREWAVDHAADFR